MIPLEQNIERRKFKRLTPKYETIVFNGEVFGQLIDISKNGLAFVYTSDHVKVRDFFLELDIICSHPKVHISKLLCKSVIDKGLQETSDSKAGMARRRSVQFDSVSDEQRFMIDQFILSATDNSH